MDESADKINEDEPNTYELYSQVVEEMNQDIYYYEENIIDMWDDKLHYEQNISYIKDQEGIRYISHSYRTDWNDLYIETIKEQPFHYVLSNGKYYDLWTKWDGYCRVNVNEYTHEEDYLFNNKMEFSNQEDTISDMSVEVEGQTTILIFNYVNLNGHVNEEMRFFIGESGYIEKIILQSLSKDGDLQVL